MSRQNEQRQLLPAYHHRGLLVGWRCSRCHKPFRIPLEQATDEFAPEPVLAEFQKHSCAETIIQEYGDRSKNAS
jgi:uncharacterized metal-binding protein YceD (DUF177 family)